MEHVPNSLSFCVLQKTPLLILITVGVTIAISTMISILLSRIGNLYIPSLGTVKTLGMEAYWDRNLENKTEAINWGHDLAWGITKRHFIHKKYKQHRIDSSLNTTNWNPINISDYKNLTWDYNEATIQPGETIEVKLILSPSSSNSFILYFITNDVKQFSFNIIINTDDL